MYDGVKCYKNCPTGSWFDNQNKVCVCNWGTIMTTDANGKDFCVKDCSEPNQIADQWGSCVCKPKHTKYDGTNCVAECPSG